MSGTLRTILIVDDDAQTRAYCRTTLEQPGYIVSEASNGKEALAAIEGTSFDLIVLDLCMPHMDGFEFLTAVRVPAPNLKIIAISGFMHGTILAAAELFGASATLRKPFSRESLLSAVAGLLARNGPLWASV